MDADLDAKVRRQLLDRRALGADDQAHPASDLQEDEERRSLRTKLMAHSRSKPLTLRDCVILPPAAGAVAVRVAALGVAVDRATGAEDAAATATFAGGAAGDGDLAAEAAAALAEPAATTAAAVAGAGACDGAGDATAGAGAGVAIAAATAGLAGAVAVGAAACACASTCCCTCGDGVNAGAEAVSCTLPVDAILPGPASRHRAPRDPGHERLGAAGTNDGARRARTTGFARHDLPSLEKMGWLVAICLAIVFKRVNRTRSR